MRLRFAGLAAALLLLLAPPVPAVMSQDGADQALLADADYAAGRVALKAGEFSAALNR